MLDEKLTQRTLVNPPHWGALAGPQQGDAVPTPEQLARERIDARLVASGWLVQDRADMDIGAGCGVAVREFPMKQGFGCADYLLYVDRKAAGAIEAKAAGTLAGVEAQSAKYAAGLPDGLPAQRRPLPCLFASNGAVNGGML